MEFSCHWFIVEEHVLLSALQHIFAGSKRTRDQKLSFGLKSGQVNLSSLSQRRGTCAVECVAAHLCGCWQQLDLLSYLMACQKFPSVCQDVHARMSAFSFATEQSNSEDVSIVHARMSQLSLVTERVSPETDFVQRYWNSPAMQDAVPAQHEPLLIHGGVPFALSSTKKSIRFLSPGGRLGLRLETRHLSAGIT